MFSFVEIKSNSIHRRTQIIRKYLYKIFYGRITVIHTSPKEFESRAAITGHFELVDEKNPGREITLLS